MKSEKLPSISHFSFPLWKWKMKNGHPFVSFHFYLRAKSRKSDFIFNFSVCIPQVKKEK